MKTRRAARSSVGASVVGTRRVAGCGRIVAFNHSHYYCRTVPVVNNTGLRLRQQWRSETRAEVDLNQNCSRAEELTGWINVPSARRLQKIDDQNRGSAPIKTRANPSVERQRSVSAALVGRQFAAASLVGSAGFRRRILID